MTTFPFCRQNHYRFRTDTNDANTGTPTWAAAEDVTYYPGLDTNFRLRFAVDNTGAGGSTNYALQYSKNGGAYTAISTSSLNVRSADASTSPDATVITTANLRLTAGAGTAVNGSYDETGGSIGTGVGSGQYSEYEFGLVIRSADLVAGDTLDFQIYRSSTTAFDQYTVTPRITVPFAPTVFGDIVGLLSGAGGSITNPAVATGSVAVSVGDLIYCHISELTGLTATTVSDNLGNSYSAVNAGSTTASTSGRAYYSRVTNAGTLTSVSVAATASGNDWSVSAVAFLGPFTTPPLDANPANIINDVTTPFTCPATLTLSQADELIVCSAATNGGQSNLVGVSPNVTRLSNSAITFAAQSYIGSFVVASTASVAPAFTGSVSGNDVLITASFKKDVSAPAYSRNPSMFAVL